MVKMVYTLQNKTLSKLNTPKMQPHYVLLSEIVATELSEIVASTMGPVFQDAGVETVIVDNDRKAHTKVVRDAWAKFGIDVWPGAGIVGDRTLISKFTGKDASELGGFPVNSTDCMTNDQSVNNSWKNLAGGLYDTFRKRKPSRKTTGGFINDVKSSFENLSQDQIRNAIDVQPKVMRAIIKTNGGHTKYMSSGAAS